MASSNSTSTLLFVNLPPKTFLGVDLLSFSSSPNFHGITRVPAGLHFLYSGADASLCIRHGRWLNLVSTSGQAALVFKWSSEDECLVLLDPKASEALAAISAIPTLRNRGLVDYHALEDASSDAQAKQDAQTATNASDWGQLATHISPVTLSRILTPGWTMSSISSAPSDTEHIPGLTDLEASSVLAPSSMLNFIPINLKQTWADGAIGRERTEAARDRSWYLSHLMDALATGRQAGAKELLAELQLCFLMVLALANYSCLEQWRRILSVIFTCEEALHEIEGYFVAVLKVLKLQMEHVDDVDGGLFDLKDEMGSGWLRQLISRFRGSVEEATKEENALRNELETFERFMKDKYGWESGRDMLKRGMLEMEDGERIEVSMDGADEDEETGEYAPVIVET